MYGDLSVARERDLVACPLLLVAGPEHAPRHLLRDVAAAHDVLPANGAARHCGLLAAEITDGMPVAALPDPGRRKYVKINIWFYKNIYFFGGLISSKQTGHSSSDLALDTVSAVSPELARIICRLFRDSLK